MLGMFRKFSGKFPGNVHEIFRRIPQKNKQTKNDVSVELRCWDSTWLLRMERRSRKESCTATHTALELRCWQTTWLLHVDRRGRMSQKILGFSCLLMNIRRCRDRSLALSPGRFGVWGTGTSTYLRTSCRSRRLTWYAREMSGKLAGCCREIPGKRLGCIH